MSALSRRIALDRLTGGLLARIEGPNREQAMVEGFVRELSGLADDLESKGWDRWLVDQERVRTAKVSTLASHELASLDAAIAACDRSPCPPCDHRREYRRTLEFYRDHPGDILPEGYLRDDPDREPIPQTERTD